MSRDEGLLEGCRRARGVEHLVRSYDRGDPAELVEFVQERGWSGLLAPALIGAAFGLLTAEVVLRLLRAFLEGGFFARYFTMAAAMCFGGMLTGAILTFVPGAFYSGSPGLYLFVPGVVEWIAGGFMTLGVPAVRVIGVVPLQR